LPNLSVTVALLSLAGRKTLILETSSTLHIFSSVDYSVRFTHFNFDDKVQDKSRCHKAVGSPAATKSGLSAASSSSSNSS
jgi:hypothetical protein